MEWPRKYFTQGAQYLRSFIGRRRSQIMETNDGMVESSYAFILLFVILCEGLLRFAPPGSKFGPLHSKAFDLSVT